MKKESHRNSPKIKRIIVILLAVLLLTTALAYGFMLGTNYSNKNCKFEKENNEKVNNEDDKKDDDDNDAVKTSVTKIEIANFLSLAINGNPHYDLLLVNEENNSDEITFIKLIKFLVANNIYTKVDGVYIFNQNDIKEVARKYLMLDNYDYHSTNQQFPYDPLTQTVSSTIQFGLFEGYFAYLDKKVDDYNIDGKEINVNYKVTASYCSPNSGDIVKKVTYLYSITLEKTDSELRIINVVKN